MKYDMAIHFPYSELETLYQELEKLRRGEQQMLANNPKWQSKSEISNYINELIGDDSTLQRIIKNEGSKHPMNSNLVGGHLDGLIDIQADLKELCKSFNMQTFKEILHELDLIAYFDPSDYV